MLLSQIKEFSICLQFVHREPLVLFAFCISCMSEIGENGPLNMSLPSAILSGIA